MKAQQFKMFRTHSLRDKQVLKTYSFLARINVNIDLCNSVESRPAKGQRSLH